VAELRVAMVGTPDAANFGDVLFPVIARHELGRRLGDVELTSYGYRSVSAEHWPFPVRSLGALPAEISDYDLLLIGGGHIVHDNPRIATGYAPTDLRVHQPLGLWLVPALLAQAARVPVAWNAVGVADSLAPWLAPLAHTAVTGSAYVAVRSEGSARSLATFAPEAELRVVPDTAFGAPAVIDAAALDTARELVAAAGIGEQGYVLVQSAGGLTAVGAAVEEALHAARERDLAVLEVPAGPVLGDGSASLEIFGDVATLEQWPEPAVLTALIAGAAAVISESLHVGIVAFAAGVPCLRRPMPAGFKHDALNGLPHVHLLGENGALKAITAPAGRADPAAGATRDLIRGQLEAHWDAVAALPGRAQAPTTALLELLTRLPGQLGTAAEQTRELERRLEVSAEYEAAYRAYAYRAGELADELADQLDGTVSAPELAYLRERDATLQRVLTGGWWRLRARLLPLLRLAGRSRRART
jgi:lipopolysaccharide transport system ATP-binding protein